MFSITIPAYKSQFLKEAIESVVYQTYQDWELIIVDDCSPENLYSIVKPYLSNNKIHYYLNEKNIGAEHLVVASLVYLVVETYRVFGCGVVEQRLPTVR